PRISAAPHRRRARAGRGPALHLVSRRHRAQQPPRRHDAGAPLDRRHGQIRRVQPPRLRPIRWSELRRAPPKSPRAVRGERRYHPVHRGHRLEQEATVMARIKHIALTTQNPDKVAAFYKEAFGWKEIRRSPSGAVFLTDGAINVAILN